MAKVNIDLEEGWRWWADERRAPTVEIDDAWLLKYAQVSSEFYDMQAQLEQLYRKQQGLALFDTPELTVPHTMLK